MERLDTSPTYKLCVENKSKQTVFRNLFRSSVNLDGEGPNKSLNVKIDLINNNQFKDEVTYNSFLHIILRKRTLITGLSIIGSKGKERKVRIFNEEFLKIKEFSEAAKGEHTIIDNNFEEPFEIGAASGLEIQLFPLEKLEISFKVSIEAILVQKPVNQRDKLEGRGPAVNEYFIKYYTISSEPSLSSQ
ncbi:MAG: hypothetical protein WDO19_16725 [Bacteroidota bacterium]